MAPQVKMVESSQFSPSSHDDEDLEQHFELDEIDMDNVEFQPVLTNQSGIALNYHTSDHPEHKLLMQESVIVEKESSVLWSSLERFASYAIEHVNKLGLSSSLSRPTSTHSPQEQEGSPRKRYITFIWVIGFTFLIALLHITNATRFMDTYVWISGDTTSVQLKSRSDYGKVPKAIRDAYRNVHDFPVTTSDTAVYWQVSNFDEPRDLLLTSCLGPEEPTTGNEPGHGEISSDSEASPRSFHKSTAEISIVVVDDIWQTDGRFNATHSGRLFSLFTNPVDRIVAEFKESHQIQQQNGRLKKDTLLLLEEYMTSITDNVLVRSLANVNREGVPVTRQDLNVAKDIIQIRFVVGLLTEPKDSLSRFDAYFGWKRKQPISKCTDKLSSRLLAVDPKAPEYTIVAKVNRLDMELYAYIQDVFRSQEGLIQQT